MSSVQIATNAGLPSTALRDTILTHPTLAAGAWRVVLIRTFGAESADANGYFMIGEQI